MNLALLSIALALPPGPTDSRVIVSPYSAIKASHGEMPVADNLAPYIRGDAWMGLSFVLDVSLDAGGEAYLDYDTTTGRIDVVARVPANATGDLSALMTLPTSGKPYVETFHVTIPAAAQQASDLAHFAAARALHYSRLANQNLPGAAWFRHLAKDHKVSEQDANSGATFDDFDQTLDLFSGAQALAENLRLETILRPKDEGEATIPLDSLAGIGSRPFDFAPLLAGKNPTLDPLASFIPHDQHAVFFPALTGLIEVKDELDRLASPLLELADSRAVDAMTATRIENQLCLPLSELGRRFGSLVIEQVAITSSDPFYRSGTDVAMLFKAREKGADLVADYWRANAKTRGEVVEVKDGPFPYSFVLTKDRSTSSYLARKGDTILVTNSKVQLDAIGATIEGKTKSLASSDDYRFFRDRYPIAGGESALVVLPDAALRRWVSPRYRIADSRRVKAMAKLAEERAARVEYVVNGDAKEIAEPIDPVYGSLTFATPLSEITIDKVTQKEADAYARFRDTYERGFRAYFDPIAIKITATQDQLAFDMTVMPLILDSEFNDIKSVVLGQKLGKTAGHPHAESVAQIVFAIDPKSEVLHSVGSFMNVGQDSEATNPLAFVGNWATFYFDNDPFLDDLAKAENVEDFMQHELKRMPFAFEVAIKDPLRAGIFMTSLRMLAEQTVPGLLAFDTLDHNGKKYVRVKADRGSPLSQDVDFAIYYAIDPSRLLVTPNEAIVHRALDGKSDASVEHEWQGDSAALHLDARALGLMTAFSGEEYVREARTQTARVLPILNEWKRRFPNEDPVAVHERFFHERLVAPSGGSFVYDAERRTMTSTELGDLGKPVSPKVKIPTLSGIDSIDLGLTFEHDGIRAKAKIER